MPIQRAVVTLDTSHQLNLIPGGETTSPQEKRHEPTGGVKLKPLDPQAIRVWDSSRADFTSVGQGDALELRALLHQHDWAPFEARYQSGGCSPDARLGSIRYGMLNGMSSLHGLQGLARRDLGVPVDQRGAVPRACRDRAAHSAARGVTSPVIS